MKEYSKSSTFFPDNWDKIRIMKEAELRALFEELGIEYSSVQSVDGVEVNSEPNAYRCELGTGGKYWIRPYYAQCVDGDPNNAWECSTGYTEILGTNTCIKNSMIDEKVHIHFKTNNSALNIDGTWKHGGKNLTNTEKDWLNSVGWTLPD